MKIKNKKKLIYLLVFSIILIAFFSNPDIVLARFGGSHGGHSHVHSHSDGYMGTHGSHYSSNYLLDFLDFIVSISLPIMALIYYLDNRILNPNSKLDRSFRRFYHKFQKAWSQNDISSLKKNLTDEMYEKNKKIIDKYIDSNKRNIVESVKINRLKVNSIFNKGKLNSTLTIKINASMRDYFVSLDSTLEEQEKIKKKSDFEDVTEYWKIHIGKNFSDLKLLEIK